MEKQEYIVVAYVNNQVSVLNRITAAYLKRHINIESLNVSESATKGISKVVISAITTRDTIEMIVNQMANSFDVLNVDYYLPDELINKEMALYKVSTDILSQQRYVDFLLERAGGHIIEVNKAYLIVEKSGSRKELESLRSKLERRGLLLAYSRSGNVILHRDDINNIFQAVS